MKKEEITWSLMHPSHVDVKYMERVVREAGKYDFDSFEVCGPFAHHLGGMNGLAFYEPYPKTHEKCDIAGVEEQIGKMRAITKLAHGIGKPLYYWHREIMLPKGLLEDCPEMLDERGEFDLLGSCFQDFLRYKIRNAFEKVPDLDGIVLTLTEADFSVIHNSRPDRYPPDQVVYEIVKLFAREHEKAGKRFILRSFGSIAQDYEDILAGARRAAKEYCFDIETKITPYDFVPFLPANPFLVRQENTFLNAECDCLGEFLGAGYLPACNIKNIFRYVREGKSKGVSRYAIRLDRIGNNIFDSAQEINLFAYTRFIRDENATVESVLAEYGKIRYPKCVPEMTLLQLKGLECVEKINFIHRNCVHHKFPIQQDFKWIKAGGSFSLFRDGMTLDLQKDMWGLRAGVPTPGRKEILAEKEEACRLAKEGLEMILSLEGKMPREEWKRHLRVWKIACKVSKAFLAFNRVVCAYFDAMDRMEEDPVTLKKTSEGAWETITEEMADRNAPLPTLLSVCDGAPPPGDDLDRVYFSALRFLCREFLREYEAEYAARKEMRKRSNVIDFVIPGGIYDDIRAGRAMHASHSLLRNGRPVRFAGNSVFPNGTVSVEFDAVSGNVLEILLDKDSTPEFLLKVNGKSVSVTSPERKWQILVAQSGKLTVTVGKSGKEYAALRAVALLKNFE